MVRSFLRGPQYVGAPVEFAQRQLPTGERVKPFESSVDGLAWRRALSGGVESASLGQDRLGSTHAELFALAGRGCDVDLEPP